MVLISQVWVQHLPCTQIIGYAYLRVGSDVDPDLACPLYHALVTALAELQKDEGPEEYSRLSGVYGYRLRNQGIGLLTVQNENFRIILLCEGFTGKGIPCLIGEALTGIRKLLDQLDTLITKEDCWQGHISEERDESFWFNLLVAHGLGNLQIEGVISKIFPLQFNKFQFTPGVGEDDYLYIKTLEMAQQSLGHGFKGLDEIITKKVMLIYNRPHEIFQLYHSLFNQIGEFTKEVPPNSLILTYYKGDIGDYSDISSILIVLIAITPEELTLQYGAPWPDVELEEARDIYELLMQLIPMP